MKRRGNRRKGRRWVEKSWTRRTASNSFPIFLPLSPPVLRLLFMALENSRSRASQIDAQGFIDVSFVRLRSTALRAPPSILLLFLNPFLHPPSSLYPFPLLLPPSLSAVYCDAGGREETGKRLGGIGNGGNGKENGRKRKGRKRGKRREEIRKGGNGKENGRNKKGRKREREWEK